MTQRWPLRFSVYGAGDASANGAFGSLTPFLWRQLNQLQQQITNQKIAGTAQLDGMSAPTMRWVLDPRRRYKPVSLGETNTGDPNYLVDFSNWSRQTCPAELNALVLSGHGLAFQDSQTTRHMSRGLASYGIAIRRTKKLFNFDRLEHMTRAVLMDENDFVTVPELRHAVETIAARQESSQIDTLVFDACLMSNVELVSELQPSVATIVGAVDEISGAGLDLVGAATKIGTQLQSGEKALTAKSIAKSFVEAYSPNWKTDSCVSIHTNSVKLKEFESSFSKFVSLLKEYLADNPDKETEVRSDVSEGSRKLVRYRNKSLADFLSFARPFSRSPYPKKIQDSIHDSKISLKNVVLGASFGETYKDALGVSIFAPTDTNQFLLNKSDYSQLRFGKVTGWFDFLSKLYAP